MTGVGLRPAVIADEAFCFEVHCAALRPYVEAVWGWDENEQRSLHFESFDSSRTQIITHDGSDIGSLTVARKPDEIYLSRIEVHPDHQGRGIGRHLIGRLLQEAASSGLPVVLDVLHVNNRAHDLYHQLGFREVCRHGIGNIKIRMMATSAGTRRRIRAANEPDHSDW